MDELKKEIARREGRDVGGERKKSAGNKTGSSKQRGKGKGEREDFRKLVLNQSIEKEGEWVYR